MKAHAKFSASGSQRWLSCPASIALSENAPPPQKENPYAVEGTTAHLVLETLMKNDCNESTIKLLRKKYPKTMVDHCIVAYDDIILAMPPGSKLLCETTVRLDFVEKGMFGTVDAAVVDLFGVLWIIDFKYGTKLVDPAENTQLIYYALGIAHRFDFNFSKVRLAINQPRVYHKEGAMRTWDMEIYALKKWEQIFKLGVEKTKDPFAPTNPGAWCYYCPANEICPETENKRLKSAQEDFA